MSEFRHKVVHSDKFVYTFMRSTASSQVCSWVDMLTAFLLFSLIHLPVWLATAIGAFVGGVLNCIVNYKFTFHAKGVEWRAALFKFLFVWTGSMLFNSLGTEGLYYLVTHWEWFRNATALGDDAIFLGVRLTVSVVVSLGWNFMLQRHFVFKPTWADPHIYRFLDFLGIGVKKDKTENSDDKNS